jgi:hypothetical protein
MFDWCYIEAQQEHYQELLLEAERHRLIRQALAGREKWDSSIHCRALTWLGGQLVAWGCSLQARYGDRIETPTVPAVNHCR